MVKIIYNIFGKIFLLLYLCPMCNQKLVIRNRSKAYSHGNTKFKLEVPCNMCPTCKMQKTDDWTIRISYEINRYNKAGGRCIFVTFTYAPENIPTFRFLDAESQVKSIPGFSVEHRKEYMKKIVGHMYRNYGFTSNKTTAVRNKKGLFIHQTSLPFKYVWRPEWATKKGQYVDRRGEIRSYTQHPHYHVLLFIPPEWMATSEFLSEYKMKEFIASKWQYGQTRWSKPSIGPYVINDFAAKYVSKYFYKEDKFYGRDDVREYLINDKGEVDKDKLEKLDLTTDSPFKAFLPFGGNSEHFGEGLVQFYDSPEALDEGVDINKIIPLTNTDFMRTGKTKYYKAPQYIQRKIMYDQLEDGRYVINDKGVEYKVQVFFNKVLRLADSMREDFEKLKLAKYIEDNELKTLLGYENVENLCYVVRDSLHNRTFEEVAIYQLVWQGLFVEKDAKSLRYPIEFKQLDSLAFDDFVRVSKEQYIANLMSSRVYDEFNPQESFFKNFDDRLEQIRYYNSCNRFMNFDYILSVRDKIKSYYLDKCNTKYLEDRERRREFNQAIVNIA